MFYGQKGWISGAIWGRKTIGIEATIWPEHHGITLVTMEMW
jgi:hypothetical protein